MTFVVPGIISLVFSGLLLAMKWGDDQSGAWFTGAFDSFYEVGSVIFAVIGLCLLLFGLYQLKQARDTRKFDEAMKSANAPRNVE